MYEMRDILRRLNPDGYAERLKPWMELIRKVAEAHDTDALGAALIVAKDLKARNECTDAAVLNLTVAAVELIEPSEGMVRP